MIFVDFIIGDRYGLLQQTQNNCIRNECSATPGWRFHNDRTTMHLGALGVAGKLYAQTCTAVPSGLVSWWRGEGDATDFAGLNPGTFTGNATNGPGKVGQAFVFDGSGDLVLLSNTPSLHLQDLTVECWIKRSSVASVSLTHTYADLMAYGSGGFAFWMDGSGYLHLSKGFAYDSPATGAQITDTNYHHVAVSKSGTELTFYVDGVGYQAAAFAQTFTFNTSIGIGGGPAADGSFLGQIDDISIYARGLSSNEIYSIFAADVAGKCTDSIPLYIISQPVNVSVLRGDSATFGVTAIGTAPFHYQWRFNGTNIAGATNNPLMLTNIQFNQAGLYSVLVTNSRNSATSSNATLTVTSPPHVITLADSTNSSGHPITVPVIFTAYGNENEFDFSLSYDTSRITYASVTLGAAAPGAALLPNVSQTSQGKVGFQILYPNGGTFVPGTQEVARVTFNTLLTSSTVSTPVSFGDSPVIRRLLDPQGNTLGASYIGGALTLINGSVEADVMSRTNGDGTVNVNDWLQMGRFVARLYPTTNSAEFQRADCAPRGTLGEGQLKVTDWVQAGRYASGADAISVAGGPSAEVAPTFMTPDPGENRHMSIYCANVVLGQEATVTVQMASQGDENALSFSVTFNPAAFTYTGSAAGADALGAFYYVNTDEVMSGKVGIALTLPSGTTFPAGILDILKLKFQPTALAEGDYSFTFSDVPVPRSLSDADASELAAIFDDNVLTVNQVPTLNISHSDANVMLSWPAYAADFNLQAADNLDLQSSVWSNVAVFIVTNGGNVQTVLPATNQASYFRLYHP